MRRTVFLAGILAALIGSGILALLLLKAEKTDDSLLIVEPSHPSPEPTNPVDAPRREDIQGTPRREKGVEIPEAPRSGMTIAGRVVDEEGKALSAELWITIGNTGRSVLTDKDGRFEVTGLPPDLVFVTAEADDHVPETKMVFPPGANDLEFVLPRGASISGEVRNRISGALVETYEAYPSLDRCGIQPPCEFEGGRFEFTGLPPGEYRIRVSAEGYKPDFSLPMTVSGKEEKTGVVVRLAPYTHVSGVVRSQAKGSVVEGAKVWLDQVGNEGRVFGRGSGEACDVTDARGRFTKVLGKAGKHILHAVHHDHAIGSVDVEVKEGESLSGIEITLPAGSTIVGKVADETGTGVPDVLVRAELLLRGFPLRKEARSGSDGRFRIVALDPGTHLVGPVSVDGRKIKAIGLAVRVTVSKENEEKSVDFVIDPKSTVATKKKMKKKLVVCRVSGRVQRRGVPLAGVKVTFYPLEVSSGPSAATTDDSGSYEIPDVKPGSYRVSYNKIYKLVFIPRRKEFELDLTLSDGVIEGKVTKAADGKPVSGLHLTLLGLERKGVWTDEEGRFRFDNLPNGAYHIQVFPIRGNFQPMRSEAIRVDESAGPVTADLVVTRGSALVVTCLAPDGRPAAGALVNLLVIFPGGKNPQSKSTNATLPEDGTIRLDALPGGKARVIVTSTSYVCAEVDGFFIAKGKTERLELKLARGGTLKVRLTGSDGRPLAGARVRIRKPDGSRISCGYPGRNGSVVRRSSMMIDTDGMCRFERVPAGLVKVTVSEPDYEEAEQLVQILEGIETVLDIPVSKD